MTKWRNNKIIAGEFTANISTASISGEEKTVLVVSFYFGETYMNSVLLSSANLRDARNEARREFKEYLMSIKDTISEAVSKL